MDILPAGDRGEASYLEAMLGNFSASYKLYWFKGIFAEIVYGNTHIPFKKIIARMIASAWYPVIYFKLSLGHADKLADTIWFIHNQFKIPQDIKENELITFICDCQDKELNIKINGFMSMVPFRLIRPFYEKEIELRKKESALSVFDHHVNKLIFQLNQQDNDNAFYSINDKDKTLKVRKDWVDYIQKNAAIIEGWTNYKLVEYIQRRNPNVPAIPFKIFPPQSRNLAEAKNLWIKVFQNYKYGDIYSGLSFTDENTSLYGQISIDHFIPWSFVLHDELWNLCPTFKSINSQKGNRLPDIDIYLKKFLDLQYNAFILARKVRVNLKTLESYQTLHSDILKIEPDQDTGRDLFNRALKDTIQPLYQIAFNQGYSTWSY